MPFDQIAESLALDQCSRYPGLQPQDLFKALYQSIFGCGHLVDDPSAAADYIRKETEEAKPTGELVEPLGNTYCRVHLGDANTSGLKSETLATLFSMSAQANIGTLEELEADLNTLLALANTGRLPFTYDEIRIQIEAWRKSGFAACRHTEAFRSLYHPAYRVLRNEYTWALPIFTAIDRMLDDKKQRIIAIEGGAAAGKSTLASLLQQVYHCNVFHMDDFFLRPEQRTPQRYAQAGGNVDYERFRDEVLEPLTQGKSIQYRRFDCGSFAIQPPVAIQPGILNIVEGTYSCHPWLAEQYDLKIFLEIEPALQTKRIRRRNTPACQKQFFEKWLPLEHTYFEQLNISQICNLSLEVHE